MNKSEFQTESGYPPAEKGRIVVMCEDQPHPTIVQLIDKSKPWVQDNNARLKLRVGN